MFESDSTSQETIPLGEFIIEAYGTVDNPEGEE